MIRTRVGTTISLDQPDWLWMSKLPIEIFRWRSRAEVSQTRPDFPPRLINFWSYSFVGIIYL